MAVACSWLALRGVEPRAVLEALAGADPLLLGLAVLLFLAAQVARALCWRVLAGREPRLPLGRAFRLLLAGHLANLVVPMRGGEVARIWLLGSRGRIGAGRATAVVVVERTVDLLILLALVAAAALVVGLPDWMGRGTWKLGLAAAVALLGLVALVALRRPLGGLAARLAEAAGPLRLAGRGLGRLLEGLELLKARRAALAALPVLLSWALVLAGLELRLRAFGLEVPPGGSLVVLAAGNLASSVQVAPAGLGVFEYAVMLTLERLGVDGAAALAFAVASHGLTIAVVALAGGLALALDSVIKRREERRRPGPQQPSRG